MARILLFPLLHLTITYWTIIKNQIQHPILSEHIGSLFDYLRAEESCKLESDVIYQRTSLIFNIHTLDYSAFDMYYMWRVGVNIINIDRTIHNEEFFKDVLVKVIEARDYNCMGYYRPMGVGVTVSAKEPIEIDEEVDIVIVKDIETKEDFCSFKNKNPKLYNKPSLLWISSYNLNDLSFIIKISDGVVLDFYETKKNIQQYCFHLLNKCQEYHKPIILSRPALTDVYFGKRRELLPVAQKIVEMDVDGVLMEDYRNPALAIDGVYNILCAMNFAEQLRQENGEHIQAYFKSRADIKVPVLPSLSLALAASLAAVQSGAQLILVLTRSGRSARWISATNPPCFILAITKRRSTTRLLHIYKKVMPLLYEEPPEASWQEEHRKRICFGTNFALKIGLLHNDAKLVVMSSQGDDGYCNTFQIIDVIQIKEY